MSCRRYNSRTIFWAFPDFVLRTYTLLEIFEAYGSDPSDLLKLVISVRVFRRLSGEEGQDRAASKLS